MEKILVIGSPGAGKTTLSIKLGEILQLPVIHLDQHYWKPNWVETDKGEWRQTVKKLVKQPQWIIDGNYHSTFDLRFPPADTVIFLDFGTLFCLWRILKRVLWNYNQTRSDMAPGCKERIDFSFIWWVITFRIKRRSIIHKYLHEFGPSKNLYTITRLSQVKALIDRLVASPHKS